ncbi:MAG: TetR/AcrR family transcriptional regulator [Longimicrobiales bacterium]|nr:TetR/AcrR family transcriptional regulator [Longimicrobiales bacterium]
MTDLPGAGPAEGEVDLGASGPAAIDTVEPPRQARSRRSYHRLLEAAAELLADRSFDDITVDEIAERAGYTKGAFYARFDSKAALLRHLVARLTDGAMDAWDDFLEPAGWSGASPEEVAEAFVRRLWAVYMRSGHVMRAVDREIRLGGDPTVRATMARLNERVAAGFVALMETRRAELPRAVRSDLDGACRYWLMALAAVLRAACFDPDTGLGGATNGVADRTIRLMVPYLTRE